MERVTIAPDRWLDAPAAASYQRMRDDGMPAGGIASAGRTYDEQMALRAAYEAGTGNLASKPGTSLHEVGNALDMTRGSAAQVWMTASGDPWQVASGEWLRCHPYGWRRTVPSEAWHFSYRPEWDTRLPAAEALSSVRSDQLDVDGEMGPLTVRRLQRYLGGLAVDGELGPKTIGKLQRFLGVAEDGIYGPVTAAALQRRIGMDSTGPHGPRTTAALQAWLNAGGE